MSRASTLMRTLQEAIRDHAHLYNEEEIRFMKSQLRTLKESQVQLLQEEKNGFGS